MKITFLQVGKTHFDFVESGVAVFEKRLKHYCRFDAPFILLPSKLKSLPADELKEAESAMILKKINPQDIVILLDEKGSRFTSVAFAKFLQKQFLHHSHLVFIVGGAFGFHKSIYERANHQLSLSDMTFSHQLIRLVFMEQLYRAFTIIKGEPYHNE